MKRLFYEEVDGVRWERHVFDLAGDVLPVHDHAKSALHFTIITKGSFRLLGERNGQVVVPGGFPLQWRKDEPHGLEAIEAGSELYNIRSA